MASIDELPPPPGDAAPDWYPDGITPGHERYWNGRSWTAHTRPWDPPVDAPAPGPDAQGAMGVDSLPRPDGDAAPGWYVDALVPNRQRYWDGTEWTVLTKALKPPPSTTPKTWAARWAIALIGLAALAGGLAIGFLAAFDESAPGFREDASRTAYSNAQERYGVTITRTETQTVIRTTPAPNPGS